MKTTYKSIMKFVFVGLLVAAFFISTAMTKEAQASGWETTFGEESTDEGSSVQQTTDGGYIIAGRTYSLLAGRTYSYGSGGYDVYLVKTDNDGNKIWQKTFGGENDEYGHSVQQTSDGGYIIVGSTETTNAGDDVYLIKTDAHGNTE